MSWGNECSTKFWGHSTSVSVSLFYYSLIHHALKGNWGLSAYLLRSNVQWHQSHCRHILCLCHDLGRIALKAIWQFTRLHFWYLLIAVLNLSASDFLVWICAAHQILSSLQKPMAQESNVADYMDNSTMELGSSIKKHQDSDTVLLDFPEDIQPTWESLQHHESSENVGIWESSEI